MTTTQVAPDISITTTGPTREDAQLMLQLAQLAQTPGMDRGTSILMTPDEALTYEAFVAEHPRGSEGYADVMSVLKWYETVGTLVGQGLINRELVLDWLWVSGVWDRCKAIALAQRARTIPQMWENFESLAAAQQATDGT
jgi:hypothetical protein